jgi:hypothetical protein
MKFFMPVFALFLLLLPACDTRTSEPVSPNNGVAKVDRTEEEFTFPVSTDCCGGEVVPITMKFTLLENANGIHYNWTANEWVTGASGDVYHVFYTDNGFTRWDESDAMVGRVGTLHMRVVRDDGCTFTMDVKLLIKIDANGVVHKDVYEVVTNCE